MILKQVFEEAGSMPGYDKAEADEMPVVVETPSGERLAVVGVSIESSGDMERVVLATAGARELGLRAD